MAAAALLAQFRAARVVPVVRTHSTQHAATVVQWLRDAGLRIFEITMTVPDAPALIRELASDPSLLIGAGTVPGRAAAEACLAAGARFIVAPWIDDTLASPCAAFGAVLMLGALTPTEVRAARAAGADVVKVFPRRRPVARRISERWPACFRTWRSAPPVASSPATSRRIWRQARRSSASAALWWMRSALPPVTVPPSRRRRAR